MKTTVEKGWSKGKGKRGKSSGKDQTMQRGKRKINQRKEEKNIKRQRAEAMEMRNRESLETNENGRNWKKG